MDMRALRFIEATGRLGSLTKAAAELHVAQPALSVAIAKVENELGVALFFRHARGVTPTPEGEILIGRARRIFDEVDSARREINDASDLTTGSIRIGFPPMYGLHYFPKLIMEFRTLHPGIEISAVEGSATAIRQALFEASIDLGAVEVRRSDPSWNAVPIGSDEMVLAVSRNHPLAKKALIEARDVDGLPMVVLTTGFLQRQLFDQYCARHRVRYRQVLESNYVHLTVLAAVDGQGGATLLRSLVNQYEDLVALSFKPRIRFNFRLCWLTDRYLSKASQAFIEFARTRALGVT